MDLCGPKEAPVQLYLLGGTSMPYWCHVANTTEPSICGGDGPYVKLLWPLVISGCWSCWSDCWVHQCKKLHRLPGVSWQPEAIFTLPPFKRTICAVACSWYSSMTEVHMCFNWYSILMCVFQKCRCSFFNSVFYSLVQRHCNSIPWVTVCFLKWCRHVCNCYVFT